MYYYYNRGGCISQRYVHFLPVTAFSLPFGPWFLTISHKSIVKHQNRALRLAFNGPTAKQYWGIKFPNQNPILLDLYVQAMERAMSKSMFSWHQWVMKHIMGKNIVCIRVCIYVSLIFLHVRICVTVDVSLVTYACKSLMCTCKKNLKVISGATVTELTCHML